MTRAGYTLSILKKQNGKWLLARDVNMLASLEAAQPAVPADVASARG